MLHNSVTRFFHGGGTYRELGLPPRRQAAFLLPLVTVVNFVLVENLRRLVPGGTDLYARIGRNQLEEWRRARGTEAGFAPAHEIPQGRSETRRAVAAP